MRPSVGLPIAMAAEAKSLLGGRGWIRAGGRTVRRIPLSCGVDIVGLRSGVGMENALQGARWLVEAGAGALVSIGLACGLDPGVKAGELIIGDRVARRRERAAREPDPACLKLALDALVNEGIGVRRGSIVSVAAPVASANHKAELYRETHALVCDMESAPIAQIAAESQVPFLALRAVIDPAQRALEPDLSCSLDERGDICLPLIWRSLCRRPSLLPELLRMTRDLFTALSALRHGWAAQIRHTLPTLLYKAH